MRAIHILIGILLSTWLMTDTANAQSITLIPKWTAKAQFAGYYVAEKMGFYKEEGLDVHIKHPSHSENPFLYLKEDAPQAVITNLSQALIAYQKGNRIVNIMQTSQENSLILVSHSPLKGISSLQHKDIAVWNHLSQELLDRVANKYLLHVNWIRFNNGINLFLSNAVDICMVGSYNEFPQLTECGMKIDSTHIMRFADYGYNLPEDGLYVTEKYYQEHPETVQKLVRACIRGWNWTYEHREEALDIVMEQVRHYNIGTNRYHQRKMLDEILRLQTDKNGRRPYRLSREGFDTATDILLPENTGETNTLQYENFVK